MLIPLTAAAARRPQRPIGLGLLGLSFIVACASVYLGTFGDESIKLAAGALIANGQVLYRDVFSHHMPFAYYWLAGVFTLLGHTVLAARLSLLFFTLLTFALLMRLTRAYVPVGLAAVAWSAVTHFYGGHMVTYHAFAAVALMLVFGLALALLLRSLRQPRLAVVIMGGYAAVVALSNLLAVLPLAWIFLVLAVAWLRRRHTLLADVAQAEVIESLGEGQAVVFLDREAAVWDIPVAQYTAPLQAYLRAHYVQVGPNLYVSPDLYRADSDGRPGP